MATTTNFEQWIAENEPETAQEIECLYEASKGESVGIYDASKNDKGQIFIKSTTGESTLALTTPAAIEEFQRWVKKLADPELGVHGGAAFEHAMSKDD